MKIAVLGKKSYLVSILELGLSGTDVVYVLENPKDLTEEYDVAFFLSYYKLVKSKHFNKPKHGSFVIHATDLPKGRGWAPVNWALINNEEQITVTSFKVDEGCDTGPYHLKTQVPIDITDTIDTAYEKVEDNMRIHLKSIIDDIRLENKVSLTEQSGEPTWNPRRRPEDSELDIDKPLSELWPLIRACHNEDYPAFFKLNGKKVYLKHEVVDE